MQNLRKKTSPLKYKNETSRFMGEGVSFKAKLIGILEVSEARGDRMCQEALSDLKMAIRAAGEHKQRITITIAIDGLRLRDEKTGDSLYHHPVHKISFIAQDMTDSRAFGYIFGSPDTGHRFFGIKTDKAASQVVIAMRDLFQVVFALKKKEIELAKQHLERSSPLFSDGSGTYTKQLQSLPHISIKSSTEPKQEDCANESKNSGAAVADLVDLELELNSLQQGLTQMERMTPMDPFNSRDDPFGDSFITYPVKPILPPPPGSGRDRSSRNSDSSSVFSPKTPHLNTADSLNDKKNFSFSQDISSSHEDHSSGDWFTPSQNVSIFEEPSPLPILEPTKDEKHEKTKQEIMSQFDVFTELDPLELKNPPKKALNELTSSNTTQEQPIFNTGFNQNIHNSRVPIANFPQQGVFTVDPFGDDPFVKEDPFADSDFSKQDPFDSEFSLFPSTQNTSTENVSYLKSPKRTINERLKSPIFKNNSNTLDITFNKSLDSVVERLGGIKTLDTKIERECAPEPPPRPPTTSMQITPPPLPPKKVFTDLTAKPPPRPPYNLDESSYDFIEKYESASTGDIDKNPPLPLPARKAKFDVEFGSPERPKKPSKFSGNQEEDYLTPISFHEQNNVILLPPPQKSSKRLSPNANMPETNTSSNSNITDSFLDGLDITLSQLTLTGLNELAQKLHIPASQLSNMTLVQLTNYLSNYIRSNSTKPVPVSNAGNINVNNSNNFDVDFPSFKADFAANFNNCGDKSGEISYDRYAVFRELMQEEIKQTKIDSEPEEILEEKVKMEASANNSIVLDLQPLKKETLDAEDKYAALREIVENELKQCDILKSIELEQDHNNLKSTDEENHINELSVINETIETEKNIIEEENLNSEVEKKETTEIEVTIKSAAITEFSPPKEEIEKKHCSPPDSPSTPIITEHIISNEASTLPSTMRLASGSLSDIVSGSSPETDGMTNNIDVEKKTPDRAGENWAVFDQTTLLVDAAKEKQPLHSEEGISPWSSDSKEFGNGSPSEMRSKDSSGPELRPKKVKGQDGWWDTSAEPGHYCSSNRRSTDSYDEEYYDCYDKPRRRRHPYNWQQSSHGAGGHSSSSRDVSPWEEEPQRVRDQRDTRHSAYRHSRCHPFDKYRERTSNDSWDEDEDDYEYDDRRYYWSGKHGRRETERDTRQSAIRNLDGDRRVEEWNEESRHRRRREARDRRCCPDWEQAEHDKTSRYDARRMNQEPPSHTKWRSRKQEEKCYPRESQESPWEDEYGNDPEHIYYTTGKRTSKPRPSSASEIDRKTGEIKSKHYLQTGGSDGEWDKRHKPSRRSRSRDSQYSEPGYRYKCDPTPAGRNVHRNRNLSQSKPTDSDFSDKKVNEFKEIYRRRKKIKDTSPKMEDNVINTFPRRSTSRGKIVPSDKINATEEMISKSRQGQQFNFENDFDVSEIESPIINPTKTVRQRSMFDKQSSLVERDAKLVQRAGSLKESKLFGRSSKSMFEDDFSPSEKPDDIPEGSICSIKEETDRDENEEFEEPKIRNETNGRRLKLNKSRMLGSLCKPIDIKKSESVNIFEREDDPFDDDFFYEESAERDEQISPRNVELRWSEDFKNT